VQAEGVLAAPGDEMATSAMNATCAGTAATAVATGTATPYAEEPPRKRRTGWFFVVVLLLLAVLAGLLVLFANQLGVFDSTTQQGRVPAVVGEQYDAARRSIIAAGFKVERKDKRTSDTPPEQVIEQDPAAQELHDKDATVVLTVAVPLGSATLPDVGGQTEAAARLTLQQAGFANLTTRSENSPTVASGFVIRTDPGPAPAVDRATQIVLVVSSGPEPTTTTTTTTTTSTTQPTTTTSTTQPTTTTSTTQPTTTTSTTQPTTTTTTAPPPPGP